jgi:alpha-tubulin suppressor-like RCC1 family protein
VGDGARGIDCSESDYNNECRLMPVDVAGLSRGVSAIAAGGLHTCALTGAGGIKCWGMNNAGQVGDGTGGRTFDRQPTPVDVVGLQSGMRAIAAGSGHTCGLTSNGGVKCWGANDFGQLGDGGGGVPCEKFGGEPGHCRLTPVDVLGLQSGITAIAAGEGRTCALTDAGSVKCWGFRGLGDGTTEMRLTPVDVVGLQSSVMAISIGGGHICALISNGGVKCWGGNFRGQLGDNTTENRLTPVDVLGLQSGITAIAAGSLYTCALTGSGGVKCWGRSDLGQLGDGGGGVPCADEEDGDLCRLAPVDVIGLQSGISAVAAGQWHTCALTASGGVKCWGQNVDGELGDGTTELRLTPVDVVWPGE